MCLQKKGVYGLRTNIIAGSYEQANDLRDYKKVTDIVDYPKDYKLLKDCSKEILLRISMLMFSTLFRIRRHSKITNSFTLYDIPIARPLSIEKEKTQNT
jgi:hypothetical protein